MRSPLFIATIATAVALVVVGALALAGALDENGESPPSGAAAQQEVNSAPLVERVRAGIVQVATRRSWGAGFLLDEDGFILTTRGQAGRARPVRVHAEGVDGPIEAEVLGTDSATDLALLKIPRDDARDIEPLRLGDDAGVRVGEPVLAVGAPFGLEGDVRAGVVSARYRDLETPDGLLLDGALQTDAPIGPGDAGGPLIDAGGRVIGVNVEPRGAGRAGFAIPIDTAQEAVEAIKDGEKSLDPPTLGAVTTPVSPGLAQLLDLNVEHGLLVRSVTPDGPAAEARIRPWGRGRRSGDVIVAIAREPTREPDDVPIVLRGHKAGERIEVELIRRGRRVTRRLRLARR